MATLNTLANVADPRIRGIWNEANTQLSSRLEYSKLGFKDISAEIRDPQYQNFSGHGLAAATGEGSPYNTSSRVPGYSVTISPQKFTDSAIVTEEMLRFNLWPDINNEVQAVAQALNGRVDTDAAKILYLGAGTTYFETICLKMWSTLNHLLSTANIQQWATPRKQGNRAATTTERDGRTFGAYATV